MTVPAIAPPSPEKLTIFGFVCVAIFSAASFADSSATSCEKLVTSKSSYVAYFAVLAEAADCNVRDLLSDRSDLSLRLRILAVSRLIELRHAVGVMRGGFESRVVAIAPAVAQFIEVNARSFQGFAQLASFCGINFVISEMRSQGAVRFAL